MAYRPTFAIDSIGEDDPIALELGLKAMGHLLWALVDINVDYLRARPVTYQVPLYSAGIEYDRMTPAPGSACGDDDWQDIAHLYAIKKGDCEDLACARVAECHVRYGLIDVAPMVMLQLGGEGTEADPKHLYHVMVRWPDRMPAGLDYPPTVFRENGMMLECPSTVLGMNGGGEGENWRVGAGMDEAA